MRLNEDVRGGRLRDDTPIKELSDLYAAILQGLAQCARDGLAKEHLLTIPRHRGLSFLCGWQTKTPAKACRAEVCSGFPRQSAKRFCGNDIRKIKELKRFSASARKPKSILQKA
ncbi:hypothetical protein [Rhizobium phaseoli]|uniref:hypothetical protein n=1 Tax=Rhizobium phaseoli TaxID=396 RepID=UPI001FEE6B0B|nr:hypothetical protein [Rhizobium phaseoli]